MPSKKSKLELRGAANQLLGCRDREVLLSGPAGTGKSVGCCLKIILNCMNNSKIRCLIGRRTRSSMSNTILVTFESLLDQVGLSSVYNTQRRQHRNTYYFPNGSEVVVSGFDDPERIKSSDFDLIYINEATELTEEHWEVALSRLRNNKMEYHQAMADCNPGPPNHWLLRRVRLGAMTMLESKHEDNPLLYNIETREWTDMGEEYIFGTLARMSGVRRSRLLLGQWVAAEGAVFESVWTPSRHIIDESEVPELHRYIAGVDWGYVDPGVITLLGFDLQGRAYRVREIYRSGRSLRWWIEQARCLADEYEVDAFVCDSSSPSHIDQFRREGLLVNEADRSRGSIAVGIRLIEQRLSPQEDGKPGLYFVKNAVGWYGDDRWHEKELQERPEIGEQQWMNRHEIVEELPLLPENERSVVLGSWIPQRDESLARANKPVCTEDEFYLYSYKRNNEGEIVREEPEDQYNHGIDALRYALREAQDYGAIGPVEDYKILSDPAVDAALGLGPVNPYF